MATLRACVTPFAFAALVLAAAAPAAAAAAPASPPKRLAVEPLPGTAELENHTDALLRWAGMGVAGATLLHVDIGARVERASDRQAAAFEGIRRDVADGRGAAAIERLRALGPLEASFARAAVALGLAREVVWVIPFDYFQHPDPETHLRADLKNAGFGGEEFGSFAMAGGCLRGRVEGAPFAVCGVDGLPKIAGPVLLNLNMEFVFSAAAAAPSDPLTQTRRLLAALAAANYAAADAVVHASSDVFSSTLDPGLRWVGEAAAQSLRDPALLGRAEGVRRWSSLRTLSALSAAGLDADLLHETLPLLTIHDDDPALHLFAAKALAGKGRIDEAETHAVRACRLNPAYCAGLPWIGVHLFDRGDVDAAERFFASGAQVRPGMTFGQVVRGVALTKAGRVDAALGVFRALVEAGVVFPAAFMAGAISLGKGDGEEARRFFDLGFASLRPDRRTLVDDATTVQAVNDAIRFYREEGPADRATLLESGSLIWMPPLTPPKQGEPAATVPRP